MEQGSHSDPKMPQKILRVRDSTFVLPDDFNGSYKDAIGLFLRYLETTEDAARHVDEYGLYSPLGVLTTYPELKACVDGAIFVLEDGQYVELPDT